MQILHVQRVNWLNAMIFSCCVYIAGNSDCQSALTKQNDF